MESSQEFDTLLRMSCAKIVNSRHRRGGVSLHKNLLVLGVITRIQQTKQKIEAAQNHQMEVESDCDEDDCPPLEFTVTDSDESCTDASDEPLAFGAEATESMSPAADRKRKADVRPPPHHKTQRVSDRFVPVLACK